MHDGILNKVSECELRLKRSSCRFDEVGTVNVQTSDWLVRRFQYQLNKLRQYRILDPNFTGRKKSTTTEAEPLKS
jgi:hypothetical protein